jgi:type I restriction enzyme S subunit
MVWEYPDWDIKKGNEIFSSISDKNHNSDLPILAITQEHGAIPRDLIDYTVSVTDKSVESYKVVEIGDFIISLRSFQGGIEYSIIKEFVVQRILSFVLLSLLTIYFLNIILKLISILRKLQKNLEGIRDGKMISYKYFSEISLPYPDLDEQQKNRRFSFFYR